MAQMPEIASRVTRSSQLISDQIATTDQFLSLRCYLLEGTR